MKDKTNVGSSVQKCELETCRVGPTKNTIIGSFHVRSTNGLRVNPPISMKFGTRADNA